jgi:hypothetical protein
MSFLYRTSLISSPFQCIEVIKKGYVFINLKNIFNIKSKVNINNLLNFLPLGKKYIYISLLNRLSKRRSLFNPPYFVFVSYLFLFTYLNRFPRSKDMIYPISIDINRASGYAV